MAYRSVKSFWGSNNENLNILSPNVCQIPPMQDMYYLVQVSRSVVSDSATPWTAAIQASLSIINFWSLLKLISIELVMSSNHLILCRPLLLLPSIFPSIRVFPMSQFFTSGGQSIGVSASASVLLKNIQG